ncbi:flagellin [Methylobacterium oryzisoli]|uniref:flagellin n=1 Tax=Methylobacterium oryzisoli TaxID=3385502 RepID=UPI0038921FB4
MTIAPYAAGTAASDLNTRRLLGLKGQLDGLSTQLATGRVSETYGGLGAGRATSLSARAQISALDGYDAAIEAGTTRLKLASASIQQAASLASQTWSEIGNTVASSGASARASLQNIATGRLGGMLDALNQSAADQYIFGGRETDRPPVETVTRILNGDPATGSDGVGAVIAERGRADLGTASPATGRLALSRAANVVTLSESADPSVRTNFGFTITGAASSNPAALTALPVPGTAPAFAAAFASQPRDGDLVRVTVQNPDGSQGFVDLMARTAPAAGATGTFRIGASAAESADNLEAALAGRVPVGVQSATPPGASAALTGGTPASVAVTVADQPRVGDTVRITLGLRDGTSRTLTLTAAAPGTAATGSFALGTTVAETTANLSAALSGALDTAAQTDLAASSAARAASDFFAGSGSPGLSPRRVVLDATGQAAGYAADPSGRTLIWYKGDDTAPDARRTATLQVSSGEAVAVGVQANEPALRDALAGIAVLASVTFTSSDRDNARFGAFADRLKTLVKPPEGRQSIEEISTELSLAASRIESQKSHNGATREVLQDAIGEIEDANVEEVAAKLLTLQTQLQASYQTTSMLSKMSLVNYL